MSIVITGSLAYDYIMDFPGKFSDHIMPDKIHQISLSFLVDKLSKQFGGTAGNIAYSLKLLGHDPLVLACAGNDFDQYRKFWEKHDLSLKYIKEYSEVTCSSYFVVTDQADNQIGSFYIGAAQYNKDRSLSEIKEKIQLTVIGPHDPAAMIKHVSQCQKLKIPYLYDPAFQIDNFSKDQLQTGINGCKILIGNDYEMALIEKKTSYSHEEIVTQVPIVITTLGSKGSVIESSFMSSPACLAGRQARSGIQIYKKPGFRLSGRNDIIRLHIKPAKPKNTSDPTGAGDAFRAGFLAGYARKFDLQTCGQMGSVAAVYTVEKYGTQTHEFTMSEFKKRYQENFRTSLNL